ncbi:AAA family ATPase [Luminiphilus sp.]|nr:AAA family ATPase [Luminiphilus sp.]MDB2616726.1 AAA family ATPase [Luminiphilus sp.]
MTAITLSMLESVAAGEDYGWLRNYHSKIPVELRKQLAEADARMPSLGGISPEAHVGTSLSELRAALQFVDPDVPRGNGSIFSDDDEAEDYWAGVIWASRREFGSEAEQVLRDWSQKSERYSDQGFKTTWDGYDPDHPKPIGIRSVYRLAEANGWVREVQPHSLLVKTEVTPADNGGQRFRLKRLEEFLKRPDIEWTVENLIPKGGLCVIYGQSGSGKTFAAIDFGCKVSQGLDWFDLGTLKGPVVYVPLEGVAGMKNRFAAYKGHNPNEAPDVSIMDEGFSLIARDDPVDLADAIDTQGKAGGVLIIDTLAQASAGADENSAKDMGVVLKNAGWLQERLSATVILVHHSGKDQSQGMRGSSAIYAAADTVIKVSGGLRKHWRVDKNKDGSVEGTFDFDLYSVQLGKDSRGSEVSSCVITRPNVVAQFNRTRWKEPKGKNQKAVLLIARDMAKSGGSMTTEEVMIRCVDDLTSRRVAEPRKRVKEALEKFVAEGRLKLTDDYYDLQE